MSAAVQLSTTFAPGLHPDYPQLARLVRDAGWLLFLNPRPSAEVRAKLNVVLEALPAIPLPGDAAAPLDVVLASLKATARLLRRIDQRAPDPELTEEAAFAVALARRWCDCPPRSRKAAA